MKFSNHTEKIISPRLKYKLVFAIHYIHLFSA